MFQHFKNLIIVMVLFLMIFVSSSNDTKNFNSSLNSEVASETEQNLEKLFQEKEFKLTLHEPEEKDMLKEMCAKKIQKLCRRYLTRKRTEKIITNKASNIHKLNLHIFFNIISYLTIFEIENSLFFLSKQTKTICENYLNSSSFFMPFEKRVRPLSNPRIYYLELIPVIENSLTTTADSLLCNKNIRQVMMFKNTTENYKFTLYLNGVFTLEYYSTDEKNVTLLNDNLNLELTKTNLMTDTFIVGSDLECVGDKKFLLRPITQNEQRVTMKLVRGNISVANSCNDGKCVFLKNFDGYVWLWKNGQLALYLLSAKENGIFVCDYNQNFRNNVKKIKSKHFEHSLDELELEFNN
jgi:hypothetical protein